MVRSKGIGCDGRLEEVFEKFGILISKIERKLVLSQSNRAFFFRGLLNILYVCCM